MKRRWEVALYLFLSSVVVVGFVIVGLVSLDDTVPDDPYQSSIDSLWTLGSSLLDRGLVRMVAVDDSTGRVKVLPVATCGEVEFYTGATLSHSRYFVLWGKHLAYASERSDIANRLRRVFIPILEEKVRAYDARVDSAVTAAEEECGR